MGIGADDIFVFHDMWSNTKHIKILRKRISLRLAYSFRKAASAMLVTSITTAVSFLSTCLSPIMPICSFGIFSGIVITVNYLLIITAIPNLYIFYEAYIRKNFLCFTNCKKCIKSRNYSLRSLKMPSKSFKADDLEDVMLPQNVDLFE
jgi:predicted RND superfamily exporter protein